MIVLILSSAVGVVPAGAISSRMADVHRPDTLPRPPGVRVVSLPRQRGDRPHETSIAIDPNDPRHVIVSYQQPVGPRYAPFVAWSADGAESFTVAPGIAPPNYAVGADPSVTFDPHGHAFVVYVGTESTDNAPYWGKGGGRNGLFVRRSMDGGRTWDAEHTPLIEYSGMKDPPFQDKPYLVADNGAASRYAGNLYVGWTRFSLKKSEILFARSTDDGKTWSKPMPISTEPGFPRGAAAGAIMGFHAAVGRDGTVYATWQDGQALLLAVSPDGGRTFAPSRRVLATPTILLCCSGVIGFRWALGFPSVAVDPRGPGRVYLTWADYRYGDVDVLSSASTDGGGRWTAPVRVNDDLKHGGADQVLPWSAVDPVDGAGYAVFYDRRGDSTNRLSTVTLARSVDGGRTYRNYAWTVEVSDPRRARLGDYIGIGARNGRVYGVWTESVTEDLSADEAAELRLTGTVVGPSVIRVGVADFGKTRRASGTRNP